MLNSESFRNLGETVVCCNLHTPVTQRQPTRLTTTNAVEINRREWGVDTCLGTIATDQTDPWQDVPKQVFTPYDCLLI